MKVLYLCRCLTAVVESFSLILKFPIASLFDTLGHWLSSCFENYGELDEKDPLNATKYFIPVYQSMYSVH